MTLSTTVFELKETLTGEDSKLIDQGGELLSLHYDLNVNRGKRELFVISSSSKLKVFCL